jgi:hypothetical protein
MVQGSIRFRYALSSLDTCVAWRMMNAEEARVDGVKLRTVLTVVATAVNFVTQAMMPRKEAEYVCNRVIALATADCGTHDPQPPAPEGESVAVTEHHTEIRPPRAQTLCQQPSTRASLNTALAVARELSQGNLFAPFMQVDEASLTGTSPASLPGVPEQTTPQLF